MTAPLLADDTILRDLGPSEAPYPGTLCAGDPAVVWVDAAALPPESWRAAAGGHLLAPRALARGADGHLAAVPHCPARLVERLGGGAGSAVTAAVSIVRAADEATALGVDDGSWWVDDDGRPVLALGGGRPWRPAAVELLAERAASLGGEAADAVNTTIAALEDPDGPSLVLDCEEVLFAAATPAPLVESGRATGRPAYDVRGRAGGRLDRRVDAEPAAPGMRVVREYLARHVDEAWAERVAGAVEGLRTRLRPARSTHRGRHETVASRSASAPERRVSKGAQRPAIAETRGGRRKPVLVAAVVASAVVAGGVLWPSGASEGTGTPQHSGIPSPSMSPVTAAAPREEVSVDEPSGDPALRVVEALATCGEADACGPLMETPGGALPPGIATSPATPRSITLLDDYGGVRAVRVDAEGVVSQVVVLVSRDDEWLVREIYDLAHPP